MKFLSSVLNFEIDLVDQSGQIVRLIPILGQMPLHRLVHFLLILSNHCHLYLLPSWRDQLRLLQVVIQVRTVLCLLQKVEKSGLVAERTEVASQWLVWYLVFDYFNVSESKFEAIVLDDLDQGPFDLCDDGFVGQWPLAFHLRLGRLLNILVGKSRRQVHTAFIIGVSDLADVAETVIQYPDALWLKQWLKHAVQLLPLSEEVHFIRLEVAALEIQFDGLLFDSAVQITEIRRSSGLASPSVVAQILAFVIRDVGLGGIYKRPEVVGLQCIRDHGGMLGPWLAMHRFESVMGH